MVVINRGHILMAPNKQQADTSPDALYTDLTTGKKQKNRSTRLNRSRFPENKRNNVFTKCNGRCAYCGSQITYDDFHVDHFIPFSFAGLLRDGRKLINSEDNLMPSCKACNCKKNNLTLDEFRSKLFGGKPYELSAFYYQSIGVQTPDWLAGFSESDIYSFRKNHRLETAFHKRLKEGKQRVFVAQQLHHGVADTYLVLFNNETNKWDCSLIDLDPCSDEGKRLIGKLTQHEKEGEEWFLKRL